MRKTKKGVTANCFGLSHGAAERTRTRAKHTPGPRASLPAPCDKCAQLAGRATKTGKGSRTQITLSEQCILGKRNAITLPSVALRLTGSRQGNRGPPLPPPLIGCLCWLRHTGLAGPRGSAPRAGRWRRLPSCRSAAGSQPLAWSPPPLRTLGDCWMGGMTSVGRSRRCEK